MMYGVAIMKNKRVVAYCRVSTEQESQETSFRSQVDHYQELFIKEDYIVGNCGALYQDKILQLTENGIYADEGISGAKTYRNRQAFKRMIEDAKAGMFDKIYCKNIYRFSRDVEVGARFIKDLRELDVEIYFEEGGLSTKKPESDLVINMMLSVGQEESRAKSSSIQWGIKKQREKGKFHGGGAPYGYDLEKGYLSINEVEAEIVKQIFNLYYEEGYGTQKIAKYLNAKDIPTKLNKKWQNKQICDIVANDIYKGVQICGKTKVDATARFATRKVAEEDMIVTKFDKLMIIDEYYFDKVQEERVRRSKEWHEKTGGRQSSTHLLSNLIKCGNCGSGFSRKKRKAYIRIDGTSKKLGYEWVCIVNDKQGKAGCRHRNQIIEDDLIEEIKETIRNFKKDKSELLMMKGIYLDLYYNARERVEEKKELEARLIKLNKQVDLNFNLLSDTIIERTEYQRRNDLLQDEIKEINQSMNSVATINEEIIKVEKDYRYYVALIDESDLDELTNATLKKLIEKIVIETDEDGNKSHHIDLKFLRAPVSKINLDMTMLAMHQNHKDKIPPEYQNQKFRI